MTTTTPTVFIGERDVVSVSGEEAAKYLQGQLSQDVLGLAVGSSAWSFILQPQGKVDSWFRVTRTADDAYLLDVDAGHGETLLARLKRFKLRTKADLSLETWTLHAYEGVAPEIVEAAISASSADGAGTDVIGPHLPAPHAEIVDESAHERRRILAGIPAMGSELDESTIPAESEMVERSASFTKGCYTGQELVARVDSRGNNTPRKLRILSGGGAAPNPGSEVTVDDAAAGTVTSVAPDGDGWVALGYVKRSFLDATSVELDDRTVTVQAVPQVSGSVG